MKIETFEDLEDQFESQFKFLLGRSDENIKEHMQSFYSNFKQSITDFKGRIEESQTSEEEEEEETEPIQEPP